MNKNYYIYILASKRNGTLYIGVTNNLEKRIYEHKNGLVEGFTSKYAIHKLVYFETTDDINSAILREKQLKKWDRKWKLELIERRNPNWIDLSNTWIPDQVGNDKINAMQQGQALITLLFFMVIGVTLLTAAAIVTLGNVSSTTSAEQGTIAYYNAEAGIEDALLQSLRYPAGSTTPYTGTNGTPISFSNGSATVSANLTAGIIFSTGVYQSAQRTIKVTLSYTTGQKVASWQEVSHPW